jgi:hypothetical protein
MPNITGPALAFPTRSFPGAQAGAPTGVTGELLISELCGRYSTLTKTQKVFFTSAIITAPVIFSTNVQLGPMIWNRPGSGVDAHILAVSWGSPTTATTAAGAIGLATNSQATVPTSTTAITAWNGYTGGAQSQMGGVFSGATVIVAPTPIFWPLLGVNTGAITSGVVTSSFAEVGGSVIVAPGGIGYVCASATLTAGVFTIGLMWAELPV